MTALPAPDDFEADFGAPIERICDYCGGEFPPSEMDGDHCDSCADELFGDQW